ncbi:glycosyltransferase [Runella sp. SP2]|uniref:CgeB family protein n=1 Tax=Runella sp. SP2 TaxID=2268026 RepID=UPI000F0793BD|nr:glycosyltransferase [Runella sp. SP2]AYQ30777.1 glycosyltransferase family 1 protein [Runella sp. SP2]
MNILYIGDLRPAMTSFHRSQALERIGANVIPIDPFNVFQSVFSNPLWGRIHYYTGYLFFQKNIENWLKLQLTKLPSINLVWVDSGELIGPKALTILKSLKVPVVLYNNDDPTGRRDSNRFKLLLKALPEYDVCVVVRDSTYEDLVKKKGLKNVIQVWRSYDEVAHAPFENYSDIPQKFKSDIAFIGTWIKDEGRDRFILDLAKKGVNVSVWGDRWPKSPYWRELTPYFRGGALQGRDYVAAIQGAKLVLGLLSKGNRDNHTQRSLEVPYAGGLLCAERTSDHLSMYKEMEEAVFWKDIDECSQIYHTLIKDSVLREKIREAGMKKVRKLKTGNEDLCKLVLTHLKINVS